jgi:hypothetical protein
MYVYGAIPPITETDADPLAPPKHDTLVELVDKPSWAGCVMEMPIVAVQYRIITCSKCIGGSGISS